MDLKEYVSKNKKQITGWRDYLKQVDWTTIEVYKRTEDGKGEVLDEKKTSEKKKREFKLQHGIANNVYKRLKHLTETYNIDRKKPQYISFLNLCLSVLNTFIKTAEDYDLNIDLLSIESDFLREQELELQTDIFGKVSKIREDLTDLDISTDSEVGTINFHTDKKAPLILHDKLSIIYPQILDKVKELGVDPEREPPQVMHIHNKKPPVWDMERHYFEQDRPTLQYWFDEVNKCKKGVTVDGVYISGWMYFHINHFVTKYPTVEVNPKTGLEEQKDITGIPPLRDNEWWIINDNYEEARKTNKMMFIAATRRAAKTTLNTSHIGWCVVTGRQNILLAGGSSDDLGHIKDNFEVLEQSISPALRWHNLVNDWTKFVDLGIKTKEGKNIIIARIKVVNLDGGADKKSESLAGFTPSAVIIDEIMKIRFKKQLEGLRPALGGGGSMNRCVVMLTGCVCKGTKVFKSNGEICNIEDITMEDGIIGVNENGYSHEPITWIKPPAKKPCYRITTTSGHSIECSDDHPILTSAPSNKARGRFEQAQNLKVGEYVYLPRVIAPFGNHFEKDARLLGLLVGDGYNGKTGSELYTEGEAVFNWVSENYNVTTMKSAQTKRGTTYRRNYIVGSKTITSNAGIIGKVGTDKSLPTNWSLYDKESLAELLGGLIDSDGSVSISKDGLKVRVRYSSISKDIIEDMKFAFMKFGIHASITKSNRIASKIKGKEYKRKPQYELLITGKDNLEIFKNNIKLLSETKQITEDVLDKIPHKGSTCNLKFIDLTYGDKGEYFAGKSGINNLKRVTVKSVEYIGEQDVYNLTAGTTHTYVANGLITHNTAGSSDLAQDAFDYLRDPDMYDVLNMNWELFNSRVPEEYRTWKERPFGTFLPGQMSVKTGIVKQDSDLSTYLKTEGKNLSKVELKVTDWKQSLEVIKADRKKKEKDLEAYTKEVLYHPICPSDMLLSGKVNPFPVAEAIAHRERLKAEGGRGTKCYLTQNPETGEIEIQLSNNQLPDYPWKGGFIDAPVVLYEPLPKEKPADNLYVSSLDDYKQDEAGTDSVGSFHIYKVDVGMDKNCGKIVASLATRPDPHGKFHRQIYLLQQAFNARCLMENADMDYKTYLEGKRVADIWLQETLDFDSDMTRQGTNRRKYGWTPTPKNKKNLLSQLINYCKREFTTYNEDGDEITVLGVERIDDIGLLDEIIAYSEDNNVDRITSAMGCLGFESYLSANYLLPNFNKNLIERRESNRRTNNSRPRGGMFPGRGVGLFR